jgi:hypothetical protein
MTAAEWWAHARARASGEPARWRDVEAWNALPTEDRRRIAARIKTGLRDPDPDVRRVAGRIAEDLTVADMDLEPVSEHLRLEVAAAHWRGRALDAGAPVPGCACVSCVGLPATAPPPAAPHRRNGAPLDLDAARSLDIRTVARMLGIGLAPRAKRARCPFHADTHPSMDLRPDRGNRAYCGPCGASWDGIALTMELRRCTLSEAVRWMLGLPEPERRTA